MRQLLGVIMSLWGCWTGTLSLAQGRSCVDDTLRHTQLAAQDGAQLRELQTRHGTHAPSPHLQDTFDRLIQALPDSAGEDLEWQLAGYDSGAINAHAMHNGTVVVSRGLDAQDVPRPLAAAALAHEMAHVLLRHGLQQACTALQVARSRAMPQVWSTDTDPGPRVRALMHAHEVQADALAIQVLRSAGYPSHSMSRLLQFLAARQSPGAPSRGTHPDHRLRITLAMRAEMASHAAGQPLAIATRSPKGHTSPH